MRATILIVEDDRLNRELISKVLRSEGYHVLEACDGAIAPEILQALRCDLVITDFVMSKLNESSSLSSFTRFTNAHNLNDGLPIRRFRYDNR